MSDPSKPTPDPSERFDPQTDQPAQPDSSADSEVSVDRRGFFAQILALGIEGAEHIGRNVGKRVGDIAPLLQDTDTTAQPPATPPSVQPAQHTQARPKNPDEQLDFDPPDPADSQYPQH